MFLVSSLTLHNIVVKVLIVRKTESGDLQLGGEFLSLVMEQ